MLKSTTSLLLALSFSLLPNLVLGSDSDTAPVQNVTLSPYGTIRRVVTGLDYDGNSTVLEDKRLTAYENVTIAQTSLFWTDSIPYDARGEGSFVDLVGQHPEDVESPNGTHFFALDFGPGTSYKFHQTPSIDFGVITHGNMTLILDGDVKVYLGPGDVLIDRGVVHAWANEGLEWVRMFFTLTPALIVS